MVSDLVGPSQPAQAVTIYESNPRPQRCLPTVEKEIRRIRLPQSRIDLIQLSKVERDSREQRRVDGFNAWIRLIDCPGSVIIDMDRNCRVRQVYVNGMCEVPNVDKTFD